MFFIVLGGCEKLWWDENLRPSEEITIRFKKLLITHRQVYQQWRSPEKNTFTGAMNPIWTWFQFLNSGFLNMIPIIDRAPMFKTIVSWIYGGQEKTGHGCDAFWLIVENDSQTDYKNELQYSPLSGRELFHSWKWWVRTVDRMFAEWIERWRDRVLVH